MMKIIDLPYEVLQLIGLYTVLNKKSFQYMLVCKHWHHSFIPVVYRHVNIATRRQWISFFRTVNNKRRLGRHVNRLCIQDNVGLSHQEVELLYSLFPMLESLYFNPDLWKYQNFKLDGTCASLDRLTSLPPLDCYSKTIPLLEYYGQRLQKITLCGSLVNSLHRIKLPKKNTSMLINLFVMTPQLKQVALHGRDINSITSFQTAQRAEFSLADIQTIHALLPSLECLELCDVALLMPASEVSPSNMDHYTKLKKFHVDGTMAHYIWLCYIAELYPNLQDLNIKVTFPSSFVKRLTMRDKELAKQSLQHIAIMCKHLQRVNLGQTETSLGIESQFFTHLSRHLVKGLVSLESTVHNEHTFFGKSASDSFSSWMTCTSPDVTETLRIQLWRDLRDLQHIMSKIGLMTRLRELQLTCGKFAYNWAFGCDIGTIVAHCPQLETLHLSKTSLTCTVTKHPSSNIKTVKLHHTHFATDSMQALIACSPHMKHLELLECVKDRDASNQKVTLSLPDHHLETLIINKLYLRPNRYIKKSLIDIALFSTNYTERNQQLTQRRSSQSNTRWYHLYSQKNKKTAGHNRRVRRLDPLDAYLVETYNMDELDWNLLGENTVRGMYRNASYWKRDIPYGCLYIHCKYIDRLVFNNVNI